MHTKLDTANVMTLYNTQCLRLFNGNLALPYTKYSLTF